MSRPSSITDFWHRWHISLSRWLRDYLYIPLGGLWHGASWNFVVWGGYHGALLSFERLFRGKRTAEPWRWTVFYPLQAIITFALVMIGWGFFRATTFHGAVCALLLLSVELIGYTQAAVPFVYFQF